MACGMKLEKTTVLPLNTRLGKVFIGESNKGPQVLILCDNVDLTESFKRYVKSNL